MMRGFVKKLAFTMALSMVVTTAAPAGSAFAAKEFTYAHQKDATKKAVTELFMEAGDEVDLRFIGVSDYKNYTLEWKSADPTIAKVDKNGLITAVENGTTTIELVIGDSSVYTSTPVIVKVGEEPTVTPTATPTATPTVTPEITEAPVALSYEVKQTSDTKATITFNKDITYTKDDVKVFRSYGDGVEYAWGLKNIEIKDNVITIEPYVAFADGETYIIKVGAEDEGTTFVTKIGAVDEVRTTYKSMGKDGKAFTNGEDGEEIIVSLSTKLYSQGVDVTNVYTTENVSYALAQENEYVTIDEYTGELVFVKENIPVTVIVTYMDYATDDEGTPVRTQVSMISELTPAYKVTGVKDWTILASGQTEVDWKNTRKEIPAYDEGFSIAVLYTDNYGNIICTVDGLTHKNLDGVISYSGSKFEAEGYAVEFSSANDAELLVGPTGDLTTYVKTSTPAILTLVREVEGNTAVQARRPLPVVVKEARKVNKVTISESSVNLVTDGDYTDKKVEVKVLDQYGNAWNQDVTLTVTASLDDATGFDVAVDYKAAAGKGTMELDGALLDASKNTFSLTVKEAESGKSASIKVNLKNPKFNEDGSIKVTSYKLKAEGVSQTIAKQADGTEKAAKIEFITLSNGYEVGTVSEDKTQLVTDANDLKLTSTTASKGAQFLVVYDPDGKVVQSTDAASSNGLGVRGNDGKYEVVVANGVDPTADATGSALVMKYAKTGTYTVKVLEISSFNSKGEAKFTTKYSSSFKVENTNPVIAFQKQESLASESVEINDIVADTLKFTRGGSGWDYTADMIASVSYVKNESAGRIVVTSITFNVPLNGGSDTAYYVYTVKDINKAIEVPSGFFK